MIPFWNHSQNKSQSRDSFETMWAFLSVDNGEGSSLKILFYNMYL